jgi:hypothetical protein
MRVWTRYSWRCRFPGRTRCSSMLAGCIVSTPRSDFVQVYDVLMLARMYEHRLKGYAAIGYVIEQEIHRPCPPAVAHP